MDKNKEPEESLHEGMTRRHFMGVAGTTVAGAGGVAVIETAD